MLIAKFLYNTHGPNVIPPTPMSESPGVEGVDPLAIAGRPSGGECAWRDLGLLFGVDLGEPCVCKVN